MVLVIPFGSIFNFSNVYVYYKVCNMFIIIVMSPYMIPQSYGMNAFKKGVNGIIGNTSKVYLMSTGDFDRLQSGQPFEIRKWITNHIQEKLYRKAIYFKGLSCASRLHPREPIFHVYSRSLYTFMPNNSLIRSVGIA